MHHSDHICGMNLAIFIDEVLELGVFDPFFVPSCIHSIFIEYPLCARHWGRYQESSFQQVQYIPVLMECYYTCKGKRNNYESIHQETKKGIR